MPIGFAYQVVKDVAEWMKMTEVDPVSLWRQDLVEMGIANEGNRDQFRWSRPDKLFERTEAPNALYEIVWITDSLRRTRRKIVRFKHDGSIADVLIRRNAKQRARTAAN